MAKTPPPAVKPKTRPETPAAVRQRKPTPKRATETAAANAPDGCHLHALLIACDFYFPNELPEGTYGSLQGCVRDVARVEEFLRRQGGLTDDRLVKLTSSHGSGKGPTEPKARWPTYENIVAGFHTVIGRAKPGDDVYVHYSGHGGRCETIAPKVKGKDGLDEALVPIDIREESARYVRDIEIAKLLQEMTGKKLRVTVVFDSCHSGGATRGKLARTPAPADGPIAVRGVAFVDRKPRPADSLVGSAAELAAAVGPKSAARGLAAAAPADGCVVLAACGPGELANEYAFDGTNRQGALTYWFLSAVGSAARSVTFRTVHGQVLHQVHGQFPAQTPLLIGDPDRAVLGGAVAPPDPSVPVAKVSADGKTVILQTGQAGAARVGSEFAVFPPGADFGDAAARSAVVEVTAVGAAEATAAVAKTFGGRKVRVGDRAVLTGVAQKLVRRVRLERADGSPATAADKALARVRKAVPAKGWWDLAAGADDPVDFVVSTTEDGKHYEICDAGGNPLPVRPALGTADPAAAAEVAARLTHLARYLVVRDLDNPDPLSALRGKLTATLLKAPKGYDGGGQVPANLASYPAGRVPTVRPGDWVVLAVENRSSVTINAVVLDLAPDWSVGVAHPGEQFRPIDPGGRWLLPLQMSLPAGIEGGRDVLKVIATADPPPPYEMLVLPQLDKPVGAAGTKGLRGGSDPLAALFGAVTAARPPSRNAVSGARPSGAWAVCQTEVRTEAG